jgi:hypothetical protein
LEKKLIWVSIFQWAQLIRLYSFTWWWKQSQLLKHCGFFKFKDDGKCPLIRISLLDTICFSKEITLYNTVIVIHIWRWKLMRMEDII